MKIESTFQYDKKSNTTHIRIKVEDFEWVGTACKPKVSKDAEKIFINSAIDLYKAKYKLKDK